MNTTRHLFTARAFLFFNPTTVIAALTVAGMLGVLPAAHAQCTPPPSGLVAWWPAEGNANDVIGTNNASVVNAIAYAGGQVGQAFVFDGTTSRVTVPGSASLSVSNLTYEAWIFPTDLNQPRPVIDCGGSSQLVSSMVWINTAGGISLVPGAIYAVIRDRNNSADFIEVKAPSGTVTLNQWNHVVFTYDTATRLGVLYCNGSQVASATSTISLNPRSLSPVNLGYRDVNSSDILGGYRFAGKLDEISVYNRALSSSEIQSIYIAGAYGKCLPGSSGGVPAIISISPATASPGGTVTITGQNFSPIAANDIVYFGGVQATVATASATSLTVTVPNGATYAPVTVTVGGLTAYSTGLFLPTYSGTGAIDSSTLGAGINFAATGSGPSITAIADMDGDGRPDVVVNNGSGTRGIYLYRNTSTNGPITASSFAPAVIVPLGTGGENGMAVADVDGDGKLDIVCCDYYSNVVAVIQNFSAPGNLNTNTFGPRINLAVPAGPRDVAVQDLDGDGRAEIVSANWIDNSISILQNVGSTGTITAGSFAPALAYATGAGPHEVRIADVDGDGIPDVVSANNGTTAAAVSVFRNTSMVSSNWFAPGVSFPGLLTCQFLAIGDLDGDGKRDLVVGSFANGQAVSIYRNTSTAGIINSNSFAPRVDFPVGGWANGVALGDLDGDARPDVVVSTKLPSHLSVFKNLSVPGAFTTNSFAARIDFTSGSSPYTAAIGDLNNDGKPDVALANNGDDIETIYPNLSLAGTPPTILSQPISKNVFAGTTSSFSVSASGSSPLTYQWNFNGTNLPGATSPTLTLSNVQPSQAGNYFAMVANAFGSTNSAVATLIVSNGIAPTITLQPTSRGVAVGQSTTFTSGATGTPTLVFRWRFNGTNITGATSSSLTLTNVQVSQAGLYSVVVTNAFGSVTSSNAVLTVTSGIPPFITAQPTNRTVTAGQSTTFIVAATGAAPLRYQWRFNGTNLVGRTNFFFTLTNVQAAQAGNYSVQITNSFGSTNSVNAVLSLAGGCTPPPSGIVSWWPGEGNANDIIGTNNGILQGGVTFSAGQVGQGFRLNGSNSYVQIPDSPSLKPTNVTVEAWVWLDPSFSRGVEFIIFKKNTWNAFFEGYSLLKQTVDNGNGTSSDRFSFVVSRNGNQVILYSTTIAQRGVWYHVAGTYDGSNSTLWVNGVAEATATPGFALDYDTLPVFIGTSGQPEPYNGKLTGIIDEPGLYNRALSASEMQAIYNAGNAGKCQSLVPPAITGQPTNRTVNVGQNTTFTVTATGTAPLAYQWKFNGTDLAAATNSSLTLTGIQSSQAGNYSVTVTNVVGSAISSNAALTVLTATQTCASLSSGLVGWWQAENNAGDSVGGNNGVMMNGAGFGAGEVGNAFALDGSNDYVLLNTASNFNIGSGSGFTIECWMNVPSLAPNMILVEYERALATFNGFDVGVQLSIDNTVYGGPGSVVSNLKDTSGGDHIFNTPGGLLTAGAWQHVALTYNKAAGLATIYVNGLTATQVVVGSYSPGTDLTNILLGGRTTFSSPSSPTDLLHGSMDEVSFYNRALSASEIQSIYNAGSAGKCQSLTPPAITSQPTNRTVTVGQNTTFTVTATGTGPLAYQWKFNGTNLFGATNSSLTLTGIQLSQAGNYSVTITNVVGSTNSANAVLTVNAVATNTPCVSIPSGAIAWWRAEGNGNDDAGSNVASVPGGVTYLSGKIGQAFNFNGAVNATVSNAPVLNPSNQLTIECWVYPRSSALGYTWSGDLVSKDGEWSERQYLLNVNDSQIAIGSPDFRAHVWTANGQFILDGNTVLNTNTWYHAAMTYDGSTLKLYVNGALDNQMAATGSIVVTPQPVRLGGGASGGAPGYYFNGVLDEPTIYNRALSASEIQSIYNAGTNGKCVSLTPPSITGQPTNRTVTVGQTAGFSVTATGTGPLSYQWRFNGTNLLGATNASLTLANVQLSQAGNYSVTVTNVIGSTNSAIATLTVASPATGSPAITGFTPASGIVGTVVTISGTNFSSVASNNFVRFGGFRATVTAASSNSLTVTVPVGATRSPLTVTVNGWTAYARAPFLVVPGGPTKVIAWGGNLDGQTNVPSGLTGVIQVAAGTVGDHNVVLKSNGTVVVWGNIGLGQAAIPSNLTNAITIAGGYGHDLAIRSDGTVVAWGLNYYLYPETPTGQINVPADLTNAVAIAADWYSSLALKDDGRVVAWGYNGNGTTNVPSGLSNVVAIVGAPCYNLALKVDGTVVAWGTNYGTPGGLSVQVMDPPTGLSNVVEIAAGYFHSLALKADGTVVGWGENTYGQLDIPPGLTNVVAIAAGSYNNFALKADGTVVGWGFMLFDYPPADLTNVFSIGAGYYHGLALLSDNSPPLQAPFFLTQPTNRTVVVGQTAIFTAGAGGTAPLSYQWKFNGTNLFGVTGSKLTLTNVQLSQAGNYSVAVTNAAGSATSSNAVLTVTAIAPFITAQPTNRTVTAGQTTTFFVGAGGTAPLNYQWRFNGTNIFGATNAVLTLANIQAAQAGNYSAQVSNVAGATNSVAAILTVLVPPFISTQPVDQTVVQGQTATFSVVAGGTAPLSYQWAFNGTNIFGATNASLVLADAQATQAGVYSIRVSNLVGATNSVGAALTVNVPPSITDQPTNRLVTVGETATFAVVATGTAPLSYQWRFNGSGIAGATNASLVLANVQTNQAGTYSVQVSNIAGSTNSAGATLTVNSPPIADASATVPLVISINGSNATVVLDGSRSSDVDGDALQYNWYLGSETNVLTNGVIAVVTLPVATNSITLTVSDGLATGQTNITVEVITLDQAVERLIDTVNDDVPKKHALLALLRAALASINRNDPIPAVNQLRTFENQVEVQLMPIDPTTAQTLIDDAQAIIDAIEGAGGVINSSVSLVAEKVAGKLHLTFPGSHNRTYIIEASSDLIHWEKVGVAKDDDNGHFQFDDPVRNTSRYYRITIP